MCFPYGLSAYSNRDYVAAWYEETYRKRGIECVFGRSHVYPAIKYLGDLLWDSIETLLTRPKKLMDWFQEVAHMLAEQDEPLTWIAPSGFRVSQDYRKQVSRKVATWLHGSLTAVRFKDSTDELDTRKQRNGASPNVVHSLDAAGLVLTTNEAHRRGVYDFAMIHDSFATHSNNCDALASSIRDSFAEMFSKDILASLAEQWQNHSVEPLPPLPEYGNFDVNTLRDSKYFFS
jgi:DNA-directed RNA polymerase